MSTDPEHRTGVTSGHGHAAGRLLERIAGLGTLSTDTPDERLRKEALTLSTVSMMALSTIWVVAYFLLGRPVSAAIPFAYQLGSIASVFWFWRTKRYDVFRIAQIAQMLLLPALLQWSLGGFENGGAVIIWGFTAPMGAAVFAGRRIATIAFIGFVALVVISGVIDPWLAANATPIAEPIRTTMFVLDILGVAFVTWLVVMYFLGQLQAERARSEGLLQNILPAPIAERLKRGENPIADGHDEVTVLFADLVGFTGMASERTPKEVVKLLDRLFSAFDDLADDLGLEKVKTIGDAYMVVAGAPIWRADHCSATADLALNMRALVEDFVGPSGERVRVRIGLHIGPVVAGVIGRRKFAYDLWGDAVNVAFRMESHGVPGAIQVSEQAYERLKGGYVFEPRGVIDVKGKGPMSTWFLLAKA